MKYWIDGQFVPPGDAHISLLDHGLLYGDGVFEGIRSYGGRPFYLDAHLDRLAFSAHALQLESRFTREALAEACTAMCRTLGDGYLRLIITRGDGDLGLDPRSCLHTRTLLIGGSIEVTTDAARLAGARVMTSSVRRAPADTIDGRLKTLNYLPSILARQQANAAGMDEALMLNARGTIAEGSADNVFAVTAAQTVITPPVDDGGLAGITRAVVLTLARNLGFHAIESSVTPTDLWTASEVFLTGTGAELVPVREVDGRTIGSGTGRFPGPVFEQLAQAFRDHARGLATGSVQEFALTADPSR